MKKFAFQLGWFLTALLGAWAYVALACPQDEPVNSATLLTAAACTYAIGYRFYSKWIATRVLMLNDRRATPCEAHDDGKDFCKTNKWIVFGHHFAAIAGPGPLVGPVLAAQFGYLPGTLWILIGVVLGGAVQDLVILFCSIRRDGKSLGQMVKEELNSPAGLIATLAILAILTILLGVLALVVVKVLAESPWGIFTVGATVPIALLMGNYLRFVRIGKVLEASAFGVTLLLLAVWGGKLVYQSPYWSHVFGLHDINVAWCIIVYGIISSSLPVWLLLAPRDYLSTFMKLGTISALALGIFCTLPELQMPALTQFVDGSGLVVAGKIFPFCFITIACGSISGFHSLIASGTTPKIISREGYARPVGYGAMCLESFVAIMALIAACTLDPGVYYSMNVKGGPAETVAKVTALGYPVTTDHMNDLASQLGEKTLFGRTGGAATLAVGMSQIFAKVVNGRWLDLWYHFAIMFEALFILTTLDAGTRVGRYLLQSLLGQMWKPLGDVKNFRVAPLASAMMVGAWGYFLIQGVRDPLGGINSLWPLFGIANQLLAAIALCLGTTIILKMQLRPASPAERGSVTRSGSTPMPAPENSPASSDGQGAAAHRAALREQAALAPGKGNVAFALVTLLPLLWLLTVTVAAGWEKIYSPDPRIGFLAQAQVLKAKIAGAMAAEQTSALQVELSKNRTLYFNNVLDAGVAGTFLAMVLAIVLISLREWCLLWSRAKPTVLHETPPIWLPEYAVVEGKPVHLARAAVLALTLARELSGESQFDRAKEQVGACACEPGAASDATIYVQITEQRFNGVKRCC